MCGDIDEEAGFAEDLMTRLATIADKRYGVAAQGLPGRPGRDIAVDRDRHAYMDDSFREALMAALGQVQAVSQGDRAEAVASQAIVLARLAGWLAGHLPPGADMMRAMMEAMLDGYDEPARWLAEAADHHHHHEHHHGHRH